MMKNANSPHFFPNKGYQFVKQKGPYEPGTDEARHHLGPEFAWATFQKSAFGLFLRANQLEVGYTMICLICSKFVSTSPNVEGFF